MAYSKNCGRLTVEVNDEGMRMHDYGHGAAVKCVAGWNDYCPTVTHTVSVDELRDLHYLIGRAIDCADRDRNK